MQKLTPQETVFSNKDILKDILKWLSIPQIFTLNRTSQSFKVQTENYLQEYLKKFDLNKMTEVPSKIYFKLLTITLQNYKSSSSIEDFNNYQIHILKDSIQKKFINLDQETTKLFLSPQFLTIYLFNFATPCQLVDFNREGLLTMSRGIKTFKLLIYFFETFSLLKFKELSPKEIESFLYLAKDKKFSSLFKDLPNSKRDKFLSCMPLFWEKWFFTEQKEDYGADKNRNIILKIVQIILAADFSVVQTYWKYEDLLLLLATTLSDKIFGTLTPKCYENLRLKENDSLYVEYCNRLLKNGFMVKYLENGEITLEEFLSLDGKLLDELSTPRDIKTYIQKNRNQDDPSTKDFLSFKR